MKQVCQNSNLGPMFGVMKGLHQTILNLLAIAFWLHLGHLGLKQRTRLVLESKYLLKLHFVFPLGDRLYLVLEYQIF